MWFSPRWCEPSALAVGLAGEADLAGALTDSLRSAANAVGSIDGVTGANDSLAGVSKSSNWVIEILSRCGGSNFCRTTVGSNCDDSSLTL